MHRRTLLAAAVPALLAARIRPARAAEKFSLAVGQKGNWDTSVCEMGMRSGIFAKHDIAADILYTQGSGETLQAVLSRSDRMHGVYGDRRVVIDPQHLLALEVNAELGGETARRCRTLVLGDLPELLLAQTGHRIIAARQAEQCRTGAEQSAIGAEHENLRIDFVDDNERHALVIARVDGPIGNASCVDRCRLTCKIGKSINVGGRLLGLRFVDGRRGRAVHECPAIKNDVVRRYRGDADRDRNGKLKQRNLKASHRGRAINFRALFSGPSLAFTFRPFDMEITRWNDVNF